MKIRLKRGSKYQGFDYRSQTMFALNGVGDIADVSEDVAKLLVESRPDDFEIVVEKKPKQSKINDKSTPKNN